MDFRIYRDHAGGWHWCLAENGAPFLASPRGCPSEDDCRRSITAWRQRALAACAVRVSGPFARPAPG